MSPKPDTRIPPVLVDLAAAFREARCADLLLPDRVEAAIGALEDVLADDSHDPGTHLMARARGAELRRLSGNREASAAMLGPYLLGADRARVLDAERLAREIGDDREVRFAAGNLAAQAGCTLYKLYLYSAAKDATRLADRLLSSPRSHPPLDHRDKLIAQSSNCGWLARALFRLNRRPEAARQLARAIHSIHEAEGGLSEPGLRLVLAHLYEFAAYCAWTLGDHGSGRERMYEALHLYGAPVDAPVPAGFAHQVASRIEGTRGYIGRIKALDLLDRAKQLLEPYNHPLRLRAWVQRAQTLCKADRLSEAEAELGELATMLDGALADGSIDVGERNYVHADSLLCRIWICERRAASGTDPEAWRACLALIDELAALDAADRIGLEAVLHRGIVLSRLGDPAAEAVLTRAVETAENQGRSKIQAAALLSLAENALERSLGDERTHLHLDGAERLLDRVESQFLADWHTALCARMEGAKFLSLRIDAEASLSSVQSAAGVALVRHLIRRPDVGSVIVLAKRLKRARQTVHQFIKDNGLGAEVKRAFAEKRPG